MWASRPKRTRPIKPRSQRLVQVVVESVVNPDGYPWNPSATAYPQGTRIKHYLTAGKMASKCLTPTVPHATPTILPHSVTSLKLQSFNEKGIVTACLY
jgi:hypothetical protein